MPRKSNSIVIFLLLILSTHGLQAVELSREVMLLIGYDDNVDEMPDCEKTGSRFLSFVPEFSISAALMDGMTTSAGYRLDYTQHLDEAQRSKAHHLVWSDITIGLQSGLFTSLSVQIEALENRSMPEDDGMGYSLSSGLTYHVSEWFSMRARAAYYRWHYDSLDFDTGRATIRLESDQLDDRYEAEVNIISMLSLKTNLAFGYRIVDNTSNNSISEYNGNMIIARMQSAITSDTGMVMEYAMEERDYDNWRAGRMLKGQLREDRLKSLNLVFEHTFSENIDLFVNYALTRNDSNQKYHAYERRLIYGGVRLNW